MSRPLRMATGLALASLLAGFAAPLEALRALYQAQVQAGKTPGGAAPLGAEPLGRAAAPFATRLDATARVRRLYRPQASLTGSAEERARQLLDLEVSKGAGTLPELAATAIVSSPSGTHVRLRQSSHGIPIWGAEAVVSFDRALAPTVVACDLEDLGDVSPAAATLDSSGACDRALQALGPVEGILAPPRAALWWRSRAAAWRLEYRVEIACNVPPGDWEIWIDAQDGAVRERSDRTVFDRASTQVAAVDGSAAVFLPDPCLASGDPSLQDLADSDAAVPASLYVPVLLPELEQSADGWIRLRGPWVRLVDWESPVGPPDSSRSRSFQRSRSEPGFEDAMVYYHLDAMQRWYRSLGFTNANAVHQVADAHGLAGADNSKFVPSLHKLAYGEGGVDDAEDAEVIVHEYGHATQFDIVPTWGTGGHTGAMGEGFGDYLANSYAWSLFPSRVASWNGVFQWDGHNQFWAGRRAIDTSLLYPRDAALAVHRSGTLWCSALTDALYALGDRAVMDRLVLDHHYALTGSATMEDAANAILASDVALYGGQHLGVLVETFGRWGLVDPTDWSPVQILHVPLDITTRAQGAPQLAARVVSSAAPIDAGSVVAMVRSRGGAWLPVVLAAQGGDLYSAILPAPAGEDVDLEYWLEARDTVGHVARLPASLQSCFTIAIGRVADRFETDSGWTAGLPTDTATSGRWVRAVPVGTSAQTGLDHTPGGAACFVTGNATAGAPAGEGDVDGGVTTLLSPVWDLRGVTSARLSYWRCFSNDLGASPDEDPWDVDVSNDGGATWSMLEHTTVSEPGWRRMEFDLGDRLGLLDRVRVRFAVRDQAQSSLVEAALDDVLLQVRTAVDAAIAPAPEPGCLSNAPNPCNPGTRIGFRLESPGRARLAIYDARGRLVVRLLDAPLAAGTHSADWDGRDARGLPVAGGVYLATLGAGSGTTTRKLVVVR